jgi:cysteine synthase A
MARYDNVLDAIGNTPSIRLNRLAPEGREVWVKLESKNPMGSVKDRMARAVIERAEASGELRPGQTVIEATSGNTGLGLAMVCAAKGYPLVVVMAENFSLERRKMLRFLGARVVLTPASEKGTGMLDKAVELAEAHGWYLCRQFDNEANADVHTETTAQEILADFEGDRLDCFVTGFGTGGTLKGVARGLKAADPRIRVVAAEPDNAPVLASGVAQKRGADGQPSESHPHFRPHLMQGWSPDFISRLTEDAMRSGLVDEIVPVSGARAIELSRELARREGIFVGTSSGATLAAALDVARRSPVGAKIVCMLPDTGERYLSTPLFDGIGEDMNDEENEIARSTPGYRFDAPAPVCRSDDAEPVAAPPATVSLDAEAVRFVHEIVAQKPIVMFALEWCEFCWSARKLFARLGLEYESVDLDSVRYQQDDLGGRIRAVLGAETGVPTIPQIWVGGEHVGGCTDLFDRWADGGLRRSLAALGIEPDEQPDFDPYELLPGWLHPRKAS